MTSTERPIITFLTDFGLNGATAACRGVMLSICRDAQIIDVGHDIRKFAIRDGAFLLRFALPVRSGRRPRRRRRPRSGNRAPADRDPQPSAATC